MLEPPPVLSRVPLVVPSPARRASPLTPPGWISLAPPRGFPWPRKIRTRKAPSRVPPLQDGFARQGQIEAAASKLQVGTCVESQRLEMCTAPRIWTNLAQDEAVVLEVALEQIGVASSGNPRTTR